MGGRKHRGIVGTCWAPTLTGFPSTAVLLRTTCAPFCRNLSWTWRLYVGANDVGKPEWWMGLLPAKSREKHWAGNKARQTTYDSFINPVTWWIWVAIVFVVTGEDCFACEQSGSIWAGRGWGPWCWQRRWGAPEFPLVFEVSLPSGNLS